LLLLHHKAMRPWSLGPWVSGLLGHGASSRIALVASAITASTATTATKAQASGHVNQE